MAERVEVAEPASHHFPAGQVHKAAETTLVAVVKVPTRQEYSLAFALVPDVVVIVWAVAVDSFKQALPAEQLCR